MKKIFLIIVILVLSISVINAQTSGPSPGIKELKTIEASAPVKEIIYKIEQSNLEKDITLNGQDVIVSGSDNKITIKGSIGKITISGKNNEIDVETVKAIYLSADYNFVSWQTSQNSNGKPVITDKAGYNNVGRKTVNAMDKKDD